MERYLKFWFSAHNLQEFFESYSLLRDEKAAAILPKLAVELSLVLFAITIDVPELNVASKSSSAKPEPIIAVPSSSKVVKSSTGAHRRNIDEFEETVKVREAVPIVTTLVANEERSNVDQYMEKLRAAPMTTEGIQNFTDMLSISSTGSPSVSTKDDDTISQSSSSSDEYSAAQQPEEPEIAINTANQIDNEVLMQKQRERIMELENQVLELTLENSRLKHFLGAMKVNTLGNFQISIPRAVLQKTKTKNFYIYEINLRTKTGSESWTIFKRYRDFHTLHKMLRKQHLQIKVLDFPPKKKLGNLEFDFVEERRQRLQVYMRHVLQNLPELAHCDSRALLEAKCSFFRS